MRVLHYSAWAREKKAVTVLDSHPERPSIQYNLDCAPVLHVADVGIHNDASPAGDTIALHQSAGIVARSACLTLGLARRSSGHCDDRSAHRYVVLGWTNFDNEGTGLGRKTDMYRRDGEAGFAATSISGTSPSTSTLSSLTTYHMPRGCPCTRPHGDPAQQWRHDHASIISGNDADILVGYPKEV